MDEKRKRLAAAIAKLTDDIVADVRAVDAMGYEETLSVAADGELVGIATNHYGQPIDLQSREGQLLTSGFAFQVIGEFCSTEGQGVAGHAFLTAVDSFIEEVRKFSAWCSHAWLDDFGNIYEELRERKIDLNELAEKVLRCQLLLRHSIVPPVWSDEVIDVLPRQCKWIAKKWNQTGLAPSFEDAAKLCDWVPDPGSEKPFLENAKGVIKRFNDTLKFLVADVRAGQKDGKFRVKAAR